MTKDRIPMTNEGSMSQWGRWFLSLVLCSLRGVAGGWGIEERGGNGVFGAICVWANIWL